MTILLRPAFISACLCWTPAMPAQEQPSAERQPIPLASQMVLDDFRAAYRKGVVAEEVTVTVRPGAGPERSDRVVLRVDAAGVRTDDGPRSVLLELGPLRLWLGAGRLIAVHHGEPGLYYERELPSPWDAATLSTVLPPLPLPQLAALSPDPDALDAPTPFTLRVRWTTGQLDPVAEPPLAMAAGVCEGGDVSLVIAGETGRLVRFTYSPPAAAGLEITALPIEPGDPAAWRPATDGLEAVSSLAELRTGRTPAPLQPGDPVPDLTLLGADLSAWSLHEALRAAAAGAGAGEPAPAAILILFRAAPGADASPDARVALEAVRQLVAPSTGAPERLVTRSGAVIDLGEFSRDGFQELRRQWGPTDPARSTPADDLLWASSPAQTIDRFARDAGAVLAVIGADRTLLGVLPVDGRAADAASLADEVRSLLRGP